MKAIRYPTGEIWALEKGPEISETVTGFFLTTEEMDRILIKMVEVARVMHINAEGNWFNVSLKECLEEFERRHKL